MTRERQQHAFDPLPALLSPLNSMHPCRKPRWGLLQHGVHTWIWGTW